MRLGLIGDIHGDIRAFETALGHLEGHDVHRILCTGDLVGYGPSGDAVVKLAAECGIPCVRGNHDRWALERKQVIGPQGWKLARFKDATWSYLANLPSSLTFAENGRTVSVHHGSPESDLEFVTPYKPLPPSVEQFWEKTSADILILGHTHIPMIDRTGPGLIVNPGSTHGVTGINTSYSFSVIDLETLRVWIYDIKLGREIRRDPIYDDADRP